ncbi:hypothetical protein KJ966_09480 [bacterium]|nr:hypothetical protein [bacterium]
MKNIIRYKASLMAVLVSMVIISLALFGQIEIFEHLIFVLEYCEKAELDELLLCAILILIGSVFDARRLIKDKKHQLYVEEQRLVVLQATMMTVQDIVNNFLNNLYIFKKEAENTSALSPVSIERLNSMIFETSRKLKLIGDLKSTPEKHSPSGLMGLDIDLISTDQV